MTQPDTNNVFISGHLVADPQHRAISGGLPVANAKLIVTSRILSTAQRAVQTTLNLVFFGPMADEARTLHGGERVYIEGEIVARSTSATEKRTVTEIVVRKLFRLAASGEPAPGPHSPANSVPATTASDENPRDWA